MNVREEADGGVLVEGAYAPHLEALAQIPELLRSDDPRVRDRRLPRTYQDEEEERQWRRLVGDDLEHLFAGQADIVAKDLAAIETVPSMGIFGLGRSGWRLRIPARHRQAWLSALNGASHALYVLHDMSPDDVHRELDEFDDPAAAWAVLRIHVFGALIAAMLDLEGFGFPDEPGASDGED